MFFSSLIFSYQIFRKSNDLNQIVVNIPRSWWWAPVSASFALINSDGDILDVGFVEISSKTTRLIFENVKDGYSLKVILRYSGFFWDRRQTIEITPQYRLKPARNLRTKILRVY